MHDLNETAQIEPSDSKIAKEHAKLKSKSYQEVEGNERSTAHCGKASIDPNLDNSNAPINVVMMPIVDSLSF